MASPDSLGLGRNVRSERREMTMAEFIRTKRVQKRERSRKSKLGIKKLINKMEHKLVTGTHIPGSVLVASSAPPYSDNDSDCDSWGSDFDDDDDDDDEDENTGNSAWEAQEEVENDINTRLEAAMERNRSLENSRLDNTETEGPLPTRSNANFSSERPDLSTTSPGAPPLPPRNPGLATNIPPGHRNRSPGASATSIAPSTSGTSQNVPSGRINEIPLNRPRGIRLSSSRTITTPTPVSPAPTESSSTASSTSLESPVQHISSSNRRVFPPDVCTTTTNNPPLLSSGPSAMRPAVNITSSLPLGEVNNANVETNKDISSSGVTYEQVEEVLNNLAVTQPHLSIPSTEPAGHRPSAATTLPPPLPSRPPPVARFQINIPGVRRVPLRSASVSSARPSKNDTGLSNPTRPSAVGLFPRTTKSQMYKASSSDKFGASSTPSGRGNLQPKYLRPKSTSITFTVPTFLRELDNAVLQQVLPKTSCKPANLGDSEQSVARSVNGPRDNEKAEAPADKPSDDYLNPNSPSPGTSQFMPERPTLPRRQKQSRSLSLINMADNMKGLRKTRISTSDEKDQHKSHQQPSQAANETSEMDPHFPGENEEVFSQPWYHPVTWPQAQFKLTGMGQDGAFLVRPSSKVLQGVPYTLSVFFRGRIINCHICCTVDKKYTLGKPKPNLKAFDTITELIRYFQSTPAELKISEAEPISKVCLLITPPKENDKIYADA